MGIQCSSRPLPDWQVPVAVGQTNSALVIAIPGNPTCRNAGYMGGCGNAQKVSCPVELNSTPHCTGTPAASHSEGVRYLRLMLVAERGRGRRRGDEGENDMVR